MIFYEKNNIDSIISAVIRNLSAKKRIIYLSWDNDPNSLLEQIAIKKPLNNFLDTGVFSIHKFDNVIATPTKLSTEIISDFITMSAKRTFSAGFKKLVLFIEIDWVVNNDYKFDPRNILNAFINSGIKDIVVKFCVSSIYSRMSIFKDYIIDSSTFKKLPDEKKEQQYYKINTENISTIEDKISENQLNDTMGNDKEIKSENYNDILKKLSSIKYNMLFDDSPDWYILIDTNQKIVYVNNTITIITGRDASFFIGKNIDASIIEFKDLDCAKMINTILVNGTNIRNVYKIKIDKNYVYLDMTISPVYNGKREIQFFLISAKNVTAEHKITSRLNYLAYFDELSGLPNRQYFLDYLDDIITRAEKESRIMALLICDLDRFKLINDTYSSKIGDRVIYEISKRLKDSVFDQKCVSRFGSDEFGIIFYEELLDGDLVVAVERLMKNVSKLIIIDEVQLVVTLSIGISVYPYDAEESSFLLQYSDKALWHAKQNGRNRYSFYAENMNVKASDFLIMEKLLFDALKNKEFKLLFQPYYQVEDEKLAGMEALLRWENDNLGNVSPEKFVPILEETNLILPVGEWIIESVCKLIKKWESNNLNIVPVSINISTVQFRQRDFITKLEMLIKKYKVNPVFLVFEITESTFMEDVDFTQSILERMKALGFKISIDDFGTGYSSLAYLKKFPVDNLKIDISFIRDISEEDDASMVTAIISMAHNLNLKTIAEGVENREQWNILKILKCDIIQGFYKSRPLSKDAIFNLLDKKPVV